MATTTTEKKKFAAFKKTADGKYLAFGTIATAVAKEFELETRTTTNNHIILEIEETDFEGYKTLLEERGYNVKIEDMKPNVNVKMFNGGALVFGDAANEVKEHFSAWELEVKMTQGERPSPMTRITTEQLEEVKTFLGEKYTVKLIES